MDLDKMTAKELLEKINNECKVYLDPKDRQGQLTGNLRVAIMLYADEDGKGYWVPLSKRGNCNLTEKAISAMLAGEWKGTFIPWGDPNFSPKTQSKVNTF